MGATSVGGVIKTGIPWAIGIRGAISIDCHSRSKEDAAIEFANGQIAIFQGKGLWS